MTSTLERSYQNEPAPTEAEERAITREVLLLLGELHPVAVRDGRIVVPDDASEDLAARIRRYEGELLWATGRESGPRWGCSWVPARTPVPVLLKRPYRRKSRTA